LLTAWGFLRPGTLESYPFRTTRVQLSAVENEKEKSEKPGSLAIRRPRRWEVPIEARSGETVEKSIKFNCGDRKS